MLQLTIKAKPYFLPINADVTPAKFKLKFSSYSFCHNQRVYHIFNCHFNSHYTSVNYFPAYEVYAQMYSSCALLKSFDDPICGLRSLPQLCEKYLQIKFV